MNWNIVYWMAFVVMMASFLSAGVFGEILLWVVGAALFLVSIGAAIMEMKAKR